LAERLGKVVRRPFVAIYRQLWIVTWGVTARRRRRNVMGGFRSGRGSFDTYCVASGGVVRGFLQPKALKSRQRLRKVAVAWTRQVSLLTLSSLSEQ
jgi:hypothetical protein